MGFNRPIIVNPVCLSVALLISGSLIGCDGAVRPPLRTSTQGLIEKYTPSSNNTDPGTTPEPFSFIPSSIKGQYIKALQDNDTVTAKRVRNEVIADLLQIGSDYHAQIDQHLYNGFTSASTTLDIVGIGASAFATVFNAESTQKTLAGISTLAQGSRESISKQMFMSKSIDAVIAQMRSIRAQKELGIRQRMGAEADAYSLQMASVDCFNFILSGTVTDGLSELANEARNKQNQVEEALNKVRTTGEKVLVVSHTNSASSDRAAITKMMLNTDVVAAQDPHPSKTEQIRAILQINGIDTDPTDWLRNATPAELRYIRQVLEESN